MDISPKNSEGLKREFSVSMAATDIDRRVEARIADLATEVKMPGFRPGKVPASVVKTRYGKQVLGEVLQGSLDEATRKVVEDNDLRVATNPSLSIDEYEEGKDLKATISLEIMPEIAPIDLASINLEKPVVEVQDGQVDEAVAGIAEDNRPTNPVAEPRAVKAGDTVVIDFTGRVDGEAFEGGAAEGHSLEIGSNRFIPGFEDQLVGAMPGASVEVKVPFPDDYPAEHLAGKEGVFDVAVKELREPGEIKIDDGFAKSLGMESLAAMKNAVREQLGRQHDNVIRNRVKTDILDALDAAAGEFDVPATLVSQEYESVCRTMNPQAAQHDHDHDHDHDHGDGDGDGHHHHPAADEGMSKADKAEAEAIARRRVRLGMVLTEIGRTNNLQISEEERQRAITDEARRHPGQEREVVEYFRKNPDAAQQLVGPVFEDKVIDFILEMAKVKEKTFTVEELYRADADAGVRKPAGKKKTAANKTAGKKAKKATKKPAKKAAAKRKG